MIPTLPQSPLNRLPFNGTKKEKTYIMNYKWNYQPPTLEQREAARALSREIGISPILCHLLRERGITTAAEAKRFSVPS